VEKSKTESRNFRTRADVLQKLEFPAVEDATSHAILSRTNWWNFTLVGKKNYADLHQFALATRLNGSKTCVELKMKRTDVFPVEFVTNHYWLFLKATQKLRISVLQDKACNRFSKEKNGKSKPKRKLSCEI
jgi:hypothetical protein